MWTFDLSTQAWSQAEVGQDEFRPVARSGHSTVVYGSKLYIFGGILELTKELNDLVVFDFSTGKFSSNDVTAGDETNGQGQTAGIENEKDSSPKTSKNNGSPMKRRNQTNTGMSPNRSPTKKRTIASSPNRTAKEDLNSTEKAHDGLQSPTSVTMQNSFIIKNADESFDVYFQQMKKRKNQLQ